MGACVSLRVLPPVAWLSLGLFAPPYKAWFSSPQPGVAVRVELYWLDPHRRGLTPVGNKS